MTPKEQKEIKQLKEDIKKLQDEVRSLRSVNTVSPEIAKTIRTFAGGTLNGLSDVIITSPTTNQVLKYNGTNWVNDTDAT